MDLKRLDKLEEALQALGDSAPRITPEQKARILDRIQKALSGELEPGEAERVLDCVNVATHGRLEAEYGPEKQAG